MSPRTLSVANDPFMARYQCALARAVVGMSSGVKRSGGGSNSSVGGTWGSARRTSSRVAACRRTGDSCSANAKITAPGAERASCAIRSLGSATRRSWSHHRTHGVATARRILAEKCGLELTAPIGAEVADT